MAPNINQIATVALLPRNDRDVVDIARPSHAGCPQTEKTEAGDTTNGSSAIEEGVPGS